LLACGIVKIRQNWRTSRGLRNTLTRMQVSSRLQPMAAGQARGDPLPRKRVATGRREFGEPVVLGGRSAAMRVAAAA
jgi:hypothetical protein